MDWAIESGGETVYVNRQFAPAGIALAAFEILNKRFQDEGWQLPDFEIRKRGAKVYAKGQVRHADHKTIYLPDWHEVLMNRENESIIGDTIVFLD